MNSENSILNDLNTFEEDFSKIKIDSILNDKIDTHFFSPQNNIKTKSKKNLKETENINFDISKTFYSASTNISN